MRKDVYYGLWVGALGAIAVASLLPSWPEDPGSGGPAGISLMSLGHIPAYAVLTALTLRLGESRGIPRGRLALAAVATSLAIGGVLEVMQPLVGRDGNLSDLVLDALGTGIALLAWWLGWLSTRHATSN